MQLPSKLLSCMIFLGLTQGLPASSESNIAALGVSPLAYRRQDPSPLNGQSSATGHSTVGQSEIWGGTPANASICRNSSLWTGRWWWIMITLAFGLVLLYGLLAFVTWGILTVDLPRLMVWNRTGDERRRTWAGKVLKVRNRPDWLLLSLVVVSVAIGEVLPMLWSHLFLAGSLSSYLTTNIIIILSQVGPTFVMPIFHLEFSGRFTWFVRFIMWFSAPVTMIPAYALRRFRKWRKRDQQPHMDGLLPLDELIEYIHLHEKGQGYGGTLDNDVGKTMRDLMEAQISSESSSRHIETEGSWSTQSSASASLQSFHPEESTAIDPESPVGTTDIRSHRQEGSTAVEDVHAPGLKKRGDRNTEVHEPVFPVMRVPQQALIKHPIHESSSPVNDRYMGQIALNPKALRRDFPLQNISNPADIALL